MSRRSFGAPTRAAPERQSRGAPVGVANFRWVEELCGEPLQHFFNGSTERDDSGVRHRRKFGNEQFPEVRMRSGDFPAYRDFVVTELRCVWPKGLGFDPV